MNKLKIFFFLFLKFIYLDILFYKIIIAKKKRIKILYQI